MTLLANHSKILSLTLAECELFNQQVLHHTQHQMYKAIEVKNHRVVTRVRQAKISIGR